MSAVVGALTVGAATTFGVELPFTQLADTRDWSSWTGYAADFVSTGALAFAGQGALSSFRLSQIALGPATLSLDDKNGNYFDHYLDEIVYFFERTGNRVVVFEDLDRFDDPGIFLALRELNNLLNNSEQVSQPVSFVYAIRDSLFVQAVQPSNAPDDLRDDARAAAESGDVRPAIPDAHAKYGAELAASDRAKFFDLIVPIVPFISHEVAADLLLDTLRELPDRLLPSRQLVAMAGRHFTDMRVIHSIRNEYEVFAAELLDKSAVQGLSQDQLFATVLFKHLHLDDFERIRTGESLLDTAIDQIRSSVTSTVTKLDAAIAAVEDAIESSLAIERRAAGAGSRLLRRVDASLKMFGWSPTQSITVSGAKPFARDDIGKREFWQALATATEQKITVQSGNGPREISGDALVTFLGPDSSPKTWLRSELQIDRQQLAQLRDARSWVRTASIAELVVGPFPAVHLDGHNWTQLGAACRDVFDDQLTIELIRGGYLDQNFALYTTKFHGAMLSADARSYLMQYVDRHRNDPLFKLSRTDAEEIVVRLGDALLSDVSALNIAIVDYLIEADAPKLPALLETTGQADEFLLTYLANGQFADVLVRRITPLRADILDLISSAASLSDAERRIYLSTCLTVLSGDVAYTVSAATAEWLASALDGLPVLTADLEPTVAVAVSDLLVANGLKVADLAGVVEPLRSNLVNAGCFAITRANLETATERPAAIGLDTLGGLDEGVGRYMLSDLDQYLAAISEEPACPAVDASENLDAVVRAVLVNDPGDLGAVLAALGPGVLYDNLVEAPQEAYGDLAAAGAFAITRENVSQYVSVVGEIDLSLATQLEHVRSIAVAEANEDDANEEAGRQALAAAVATSDHLSSEAKLNVIVSLKTHATLRPADLALDDPALARGLLSAGEIADNSATFNALAAGPWKVFEASAAVSKSFDGLIAELPFTDDLLANVLLSREVSNAAKRSVLSNFDAHLQALGAKSAGAWLATSSPVGVALTPGQVTVLAEAGASAAQVLGFLLKERARLSAADMVAILAHCEPPYSSLATANGATLTVPHSEEVRGVLQVLKTANIVKDFRKKTLRDQFDVHMAG